MRALTIVMGRRRLTASELTVCPANVSAIDPVMLLDVRYDLGLCELVSGLDFDRKFRQYLRVADTLLELQLGASPGPKIRSASGWPMWLMTSS
jgi:hypothetical protein